MVAIISFFEEKVMTKRDKKNDEAKKARNPIDNSSESITIGDISGGTGFAIGRGAQTVVNQRPREETDQISTIFATLKQLVSSIENEADRKVAESAIGTLEAEARKGDRANEKTVKKWMDFLVETAPDAWDVAIDFFINPVRGVSTVFKKIAERAKLEREIKASEP
jgi:hypothetical protein